MKEEISFIKHLLPSHYEVYEGTKPGTIHCVSETGLRKLPYLNKSGKFITDDEDDESFDRFLKSLKIKFKDRFQEVFHNTCFCHVDFTIYLKQ